MINQDDTKHLHIKACIQCGAEYSDEKFFPFCSQRCRNIDLYHWLHEDYVLPGERKKIECDINDTGQKIKNNLYDVE